MIKDDLKTNLKKDLKKNLLAYTSANYNHVYNQIVFYTPRTNYYGKQDYNEFPIDRIKDEVVKKIEIQLSSKTLFLDERLDNIYQSINESKKLLSLNDDWDDNGALACREFIYDRAIYMLVLYSQSVLKTYNIKIFSPEINLGRDGSIDLQWRNEKIILLINIQNSENIDVHYYGEDYSSKTILKGFIESSMLNKDLIYWMQKLKFNVEY